MGNIRYINNCGRINIPVEIRRKLKVKDTTAFEVFEKDGCIVIKKVEKSNG